MVYALGIDVGTTYTAAAVWSQGQATVLPLGRRSDAIPTVVCLDENGWLVGDAAERRAVIEPERIARTFKPRMGDDVPVRIAGQDVPVDRLTAEVIGWVVARATENQGGTPDRVLLTHPAGWGEFRTGRLRRAAALAGLDDVDLAPEPIAAASYYALGAGVSVGSRIGIYDLGGGTFDASIVTKQRAGFGLCGSPVGEDVGGIDLDQDVFDHIAEEMGTAWHSVDPGDPHTLAALSALRGEAVMAKEALSDDMHVVIPVLLPGLSGRVELTRAQLEQMAEPLVARTVATFRGLLRATGINAEELSAVLLVGGASRMPLVAHRLSEALRLNVVVDAHPKYAVCLGAASLGATHLDIDQRETPPGRGSSPDPPTSAATAAPPAARTTETTASRTSREVPVERMPSISLMADLARSGLSTGQRSVRPLPLAPADPALRPSSVIRTSAHRRSLRPQVILLIGIVLIVGALLITLVLIHRA